jgi:hypothetical protein
VIGWSGLIEGNMRHFAGAKTPFGEGNGKIDGGELG